MFKKVIAMNDLGEKAIKESTCTPTINDVAINAGNIQSVKKYLERCKSIRIFVNQGAGLGNQVAAITTINRLKELGYRGLFELVYDGREGIADRLSTLLPGFNSSKQSPQFLEGNIQTRFVKDMTESSNDFDPTDLVVNVADDFGFSRSSEEVALKWKSSAVLFVNPTDFFSSGGFNKFYVLGQAREHFPEYKKTTAALYQKREKISLAYRCSKRHQGV